MDSEDRFDEDRFERFARDSAAGLILCLRKMGGNTFTEADRRAMVDGLDVLRTAVVQPVGPSASDRLPGAVSHLDIIRRAKALAGAEVGE